MSTEKIWFYKYCGLPLCGTEKGAPIHSKVFGQLLPPEEIKRRMPQIDIKLLSVTELPQKQFYATEWPT
jgi:hypothetical protein